MYYNDSHNHRVKGPSDPARPLGFLRVAVLPYIDPAHLPLQSNDIIFDTVGKSSFSRCEARQRKKDSIHLLALDCQSLFTWYGFQ